VKDYPEAKLRWGRALLAGVGAELMTILLIVLAVTVYRIGGGHTEDDIARFGSRAGLLIGPAGGAIFTFVMALWIASRAAGKFLAYGLLVAVGAIAFHLLGVTHAPGGFQPIYLIADLFKLLGGLLGGALVARRRYAMAREGAAFQRSPNRQ
jgi:hypothetical protein